MMKAVKAQAQRATMSSVVRENGTRTSNCLARALIMADMVTEDTKVSGA